MKAVFTLIFHFSFFIFTVGCYSQAVGIGTPNPSDALHIVGASNDDPLRVQVGTATKLRIFNNGGTSIGTNNSSGTPANGLYVLGNTGLGVNSPIDKLAVSGNVNITGEIKTDGTSGQQGQLLQSNGNGTMSWADPCGYKNFRDFPNPGVNQWFVPDDVTEIMVELWSAGGGGSYNYGGGGGAYLKFKRTVTPNEVLQFSIGAGGTGITSTGMSATFGGETTFPISPGIEHLLYGGYAGNVGLGGFVVDYIYADFIRKNGSDGGATKVTYMQKSATEFVTKTEYGNGGFAEGNIQGSGEGGTIMINNTNNIVEQTSYPRSGLQPGGGGGGGAGSSSPLSVGGNGGDGYVIIYW